jgi:hypothetical protein
MSDATYASLMEELGNVALHQPLWPGDTVSHAGAYELCRLGLIRRHEDGGGHWVLTELGLLTYWAERRATKPPGRT